MLTGEVPSKPPIDTPTMTTVSKTKKHVTFDTNPPQVAEAAARSMEELLRQTRNMPKLIPTNAPAGASIIHSGVGNYDVGDVFKINGNINGNFSPQRPLVPQDTGTDANEEVEIDSHFKNVNIESILYHGVSNLPTAPPAGHPGYQNYAQSLMAGNDSPSPSPPINNSNINGQIPPPLPPKVRTASTAGIDVHSLSSYQMNGNSAGQNSSNTPSTTSAYQQPLMPNATGPVNALSAMPTGTQAPLQPLQPTATGPLQSLQPTPTGPVLNAPPPAPHPRKSITQYQLSPQPTGPIQSSSVQPQATGLQNNQNPGTTTALQAQTTGQMLFNRGRSMSLQAQAATPSSTSLVSTNSNPTPSFTSILQNQSTGTQAPNSASIFSTASAGPTPLQSQSTGGGNNLGSVYNNTTLQSQQTGLLNGMVNSSNNQQNSIGSSSSSSSSVSTGSSIGRTQAFNSISGPSGGPPTAHSLSEFKSIFHPPSSSGTPPPPPSSHHGSVISSNTLLPQQPPQFQSSSPVSFAPNSFMNNGSNTSITTENMISQQQPQATGGASMGYGLPPAPPPSRRVYSSVSGPSPLGLSAQHTPPGGNSHGNGITGSTGHNSLAELAIRNNSISQGVGVNIPNQGLVTGTSISGVPTTATAGGVLNSMPRRSVSGSSAGPVMSNGVLMPPPVPQSRRRITSISGVMNNGNVSNGNSNGLSPSSSVTQFTTFNNDPQQQQQQQQITLGGINGPGVVQGLVPGPSGVMMHPSASNPNLLASQPTGVFAQQPQGQMQQNPHLAMQQLHVPYGNFPASNSVPNLVSGMQGLRVDGNGQAGYNNNNMGYAGPNNGMMNGGGLNQYYQR